MIAKILDMNAIEQQRMNLKLEKVDLLQLLQENIRRYRPSAVKKHIQIHLSPSLQKCYASLDWGYATQILENLLSNAVKFSPAWQTHTCEHAGKQNIYTFPYKTKARVSAAKTWVNLFGKFQKLSARPTGWRNIYRTGFIYCKKVRRSHARQYPV
jgi:signal transduction histidine kinase